MGIPVSIRDIIIGANAAGGPDFDLIENSLRFRGGQRLGRSSWSGTGGNGQGFGTLSMWVKAANIGSGMNLAHGGTTSPQQAGTGILITNTGSLITNASYGSGSYQTLTASGVYRDPSAWYHIVWRMAADGSETVWVNGVQVLSGSNPQWGGWLLMNPGYPTYLGFGGIGDNGTYSQIYLAEVHGTYKTYYTASNFGKFNSDGVWIPKEVSGITYGTNGFYLDFSDPGNIGADRSGNGNNFTPTSFELSNTTSTNYDWMEDTPTNNHATWNAIFNSNQSNGDYIGNLTLAEANMRATQGGNLSRAGFATQPLGIGGKYYWEGDQGANWGGQAGCSTVIGFGFCRSTTSVSTHYRQWVYYGLWWLGTGNGQGAQLQAEIIWAGSQQSTISLSNDFRPGRIAGIAIDTTASTNNVRLYVDGSLVGTGSFNFAGVPAEYQRGLMPYTQINSQPNQFSYCRLGSFPLQRTPPAGHVVPSSANQPAPSLPTTITGTFTGNNNSDGPFIHTGCIPGRIQYGSVDVLYQNRLSQSNVDFLSNGFKLRSTTSNSGTVSYTVTTTHSGGEYSGKKVPFGGNNVWPATAVSN